MRALSAIRSFLGAHLRFRRLRGGALQRFQDARARRIVSHAVAHAPFYREHYRGHDLENWRTLPTVDKAAMMENFDTFNTCGIRRNEAMALALRAERERDFAPTLGSVTVGLSSGTSGHRGLFLVNPQEQLFWAGSILGRTLHSLGRTRVAFFLRSNSNLYQRLGSWIQSRYFDLMTPIEEAVRQLNAYQPDLLVAPPSMLTMLAAHRGLQIRPRRLISVAEVLEPQDARLLEERFAVPVHQIYQCTEGLLAVSCAEGSLHVQEDLVALQCEPVGDGRVSPIVTDLWRQTQPIIRYRLNDLLVLRDDACACGSAFRVIERIEGRCDDVLTFQATSGVARAMFPDTLRRAVLLAHPDIEEYEVVQDRAGALDVRLQIRKNADASTVEHAVHRSLVDIARQYDCIVPVTTVSALVPREQDPAKRRRIRRA
jgi:putative adenylate-forming enzyme